LGKIALVAVAVADSYSAYSILDIGSSGGKDRRDRRIILLSEGNILFHRKNEGSH